MYLVTFVLHNPDLLEELIDIWDRSGADGVTVVFSSGMGRLRQNQGIRDDIPLIFSFFDDLVIIFQMDKTTFKNKVLLGNIGKCCSDTNLFCNNFVLLRDISRS